MKRTLIRSLIIVLLLAGATIIAAPSDERMIEEAMMEEGRRRAAATTLRDDDISITILTATTDRGAAFMVRNRSGRSLWYVGHDRGSALSGVQDFRNGVWSGGWAGYCGNELEIFELADGAEERFVVEIDPALAGRTIRISLDLSAHRDPRRERNRTFWSDGYRVAD